MLCILGTRAAMIASISYNWPMNETVISTKNHEVEGARQVKEWMTRLISATYSGFSGRIAS
jgi:hypothetical protein